MQTRSTLVGLIASSLLTFRAMVPIQRNAMGSVKGAGGTGKDGRGSAL